MIELVNELVNELVKDRERERKVRELEFVHVKR